MASRRLMSRELVLLLVLLLALAALSLVACQDEETATAPAATEPSAPVVDPLPTESDPPPVAEATRLPDPTATEQSAAGELAPETTVPQETIAPAETAMPAATPALPVVEAQVEAVNLTLVAGGLTRPLYLTHAFDERLFVVEQAGQIRVVENGQLRSEPFLDIQERVNSTALEQGLLGLAFHPGYRENGRFFVNYTDLQGDTVIAEFGVDTADLMLADPASERVLLSVAQPFGNHNAGQLAFGPDGALYASLGDGGGAGDSLNQGQDPSTLLGTLLRLDVDGDEPYAVPADNPFAGTAGARDEIWAYGLRNPWRFSFDRQLGDLYIADVGQNMWEEVNFQPAGAEGGANYGWNIMEASHCFGADNCDPAGLVAPVAEVSHQGGNCSITGGYVYRGAKYPALSGNYFFADYCSGNLWSLFRQPDGSWGQQLVQQTGIIISSFGEDAQGELYLLDHVNGDLYQLGS